MGWLELLPLLKRLLPLLGRVAPMLESYVGARAAGAVSNEAALERFTGDIKSDLAVTARHHANLVRTLEGHTDQLLVLTDDVKQLRIAGDQLNRRMETIEEQTVATARYLRTFCVLSLLLLVAVLGVVIALFLRH